MSGKDKSRPQQAVALKYDGTSAPRVVAKGDGHVAEQIIEVAREHDVHIHDDPELVRVLSKLELDQEIPVALYVAVAEVLAFVYRLSGKELPNQSTHRHKP